ncbi:MAG TPA: hypothetical protein VII28_01370, partial [Puia sp.]
MKISLRPILTLIVIFIMVALQGCMKSNSGSSGSTTTVDEKPTPTAIGTSIETGVTKTISPGGGTVLSSDGLVELVFPSGALAANTDISIQAIVNNAPNGRGNAYRMQPEGMIFLQPVVLRFHYTADDILETLSGLMSIAFQDSTGIWYRVDHITNDTVNKVIYAPIKHFSDWSRFDVMLISPFNTSVRVDKSVGLTVVYIDAGTEPDELAPLFKKSTPVKWSVNGIPNGNASVGTTGDGSISVSYKAPSKIPGENPVAVSAQIPFNGKYQGKTVNTLELVSHITIVDGEKYLLEMRISETLPPFLYTDSVSMIVVINSDDQVIISDIQNFAPKASPPSATLGGCTSTWLQDGIGETNVNSVSGIITGTAGDSTRDLFLTITNSGAVSPKFTQACVGSDPETGGGFPFEGLPTLANFTLVSGQTVYTVDNGEEFDRLTLIQP